MAISKYTLYKYVKVDSTWRYCKAAYHDNSKIKPDVVFVNVKEGLLEKHPEGRYYMSHNGGWIDAGTDALERNGNASSGWRSMNSSGSAGKLLRKARSLCQTAQAGSRWQQPRKNILPTAKLKVLIPKASASIVLRLIRSSSIAVSPISTNAGTTSRSCSTTWGGSGNSPCRSASTAIASARSSTGSGTCAFSLKNSASPGYSKKNEEPKYHKKIVVAHPDDELDVLYGAADAEETFLLDFFIGSMARDHEAYGKYGHPDLTGTTLTLYGKQHKTRTVEISQRLADGIRARRKRSDSKGLFLNRNGKPDKHLLRKLQNIAKKAGAKFHTELHKLRKTGASRRYLAGVPLPTLMLDLGHESLAVTQDYLADVRKPGEAKKAVADADFIPTPKIVKTGTHGD
jgi:hypothetical protein